MQEYIYVLIYGKCFCMFNQTKSQFSQLLEVFVMSI